MTHVAALVALLGTLLVAATAPAAETPTLASAAPPRIAFSAADALEQRQLNEQLASEHWPFRVFGLLRLERYDGAEIDQHIATLCADGAWQVRAFAVRASARRGLAIPPERLEDETDPRVLRALLRAGAKLDAESIARRAKKLLDTKAIDELLLGLEIAALSGVEAVRSDAERRGERLIRKMDDAACVRVARRLARAIGSEAPAGPPVEAFDWRAWLDARGGRIAYASAAERSFGTVAELPQLSFIARLDAETYSRLLDYLENLRQRDLELAIVMDATASMRPMIDEARANVEELILFTSDVSRTLRLGFVAYRDHDNKPVWDGHPLTKDVESIRDFLFAIRITGGRDLPEAVLDGLTACAGLHWNRKAVRQIVLVGDARPHDADLYALEGLLAAYAEKGFIVHAVHVPMRMSEIAREQLDPERVAAREREITEHNGLTDLAFADIARRGGGRYVTLGEDDALVPAIMHLTIEEAWWPAFDEFYVLYLEVCR